MQNLFKSILVIILFFVGAVTAAPTEIDDRARYTSSLNAMASTLMNWFGSLMVEGELIPFTSIESKWDDYRSHYPKNITQIKIISTDLITLDEHDKYQFKVRLRINAENNEGRHSQLINETFIFHIPPLTKPVLKTISREKVETTAFIDIAELDQSHYKVRQFAYAWLAYLDGVQEMDQIINEAQWIKSARYSVKIGRDEMQGSISSTLKERQKYLAKGGHLLRSVDVKKVENKPDYFILDLISEWKGVNQKGKSVLAKVHQQIEIQIQHNKVWKVHSIKEEHLLPDIAPWVGFLC